MIKEILVPTDFSEVSLQAIDLAGELAKKYDARLHLIHIFHIPGAGSADYPDYTAFSDINWIQEEKDKKLDQLTEELKMKYGISAFKHSARPGLVVQNTIDYVEDEKIDLIVLSTTGASGLKKWLIGSNAAEILQRSPVPVFSIPEDYNSVEQRPLAVSSDLDPDEIPALNQFLKTFDHLFEEKVEFLHVLDQSEETRIKAFQQELIKHDNFELRLLENKEGEKEETINEYLKPNQSTWLLVFPEPKSFWAKIFGSSHTKKLSYHAQNPLISIKKH
ncbi:MAG: universal stress protein [Cyclobacteriaceae bacterium]|nr:universal stress protein [Cyclobacteriaceae bacterium]MCH8517126.1 universal stress protein [Cyclobacteriaceae bacterium]